MTANKQPTLLVFIYQRQPFGYHLPERHCFGKEGLYTNGGYGEPLKIRCTILTRPKIIRSSRSVGRCR